MKKAYKPNKLKKSMSSCNVCYRDNPHRKSSTLPSMSDKDSPKMQSPYKSETRHSNRF